MFIAALFTIAKTWKQPQCPSMKEWLKKTRYVQIFLNLPWDSIPINPL